MNRWIAWSALALAISPGSVSAQGSSMSSAEAYPAKSVRVIVGLAPGGATDIQARLLSQKLSENLGRPFVVDNRAGAGGTIAYALVAKSPPDGYTLLAAASGYVITPAVYANLAYDPIKDFTPISLAVQAPFLLVVHPSLPVTSIKALVALAKVNPGVLNAASAGHGSATHLAFELFKTLAKVQITHVPYKGVGPALVDAVAGQIHMMFGNILSTIPHVKSGKLRALALTSATRSAVLPELPTISESGVPGYENTTWHGWLAPAGTPVAVVNRLNAEIATSLKAPDVLTRLATDGGEPVGSTPEQFARHITAEIGRWRKVIKDANLRFE